MSGYKLFYFPGRGGAEKCRLAFAAAKIDYEDVRVPSEEWPKRKRVSKYTREPKSISDVYSVS